MALNTGTNSIDTLLAVKHQSVIEYGLDNVQQILMEDVAIHNEIAMNAATDLVEVTEDTLRIYGASGTGDFREVDEIGVNESQQPAVGSEVAFPLSKFQYPIGWTYAWFQRHTPADMAQSVLNAQSKHWASITSGIRTAIFKPTNRIVKDRWASKTNLSVRALLNADGSQIPDGTSGQSFDPNTHTHYTGSATLDEAAVNALIANVLEHRDANTLKMAINSIDIAAFKALDGFTPASDSRIDYAASVATAKMDENVGRVDNKFIGLFNQAEVWAYSWVPANYCTVYEAGSNDKVLCMREDKFQKGLQTVAKLETHQLYTDFLEYMLGFGAYNRNLAACLQFNNATYVDPT